MFLREALSDLLEVATQRGQVMLTRVNARHQGVHVVVLAWLNLGAQALLHHLGGCAVLEMDEANQEQDGQNHGICHFSGIFGFFSF